MEPALRRRAGRAPASRASHAGAGQKALKLPPPAFPGMRIGLLGGSFNPPHEGHLHISTTAITRLGLDKLWWLVTPGNPLKRTADLPSLAERMALAKPMATHPAIEVTGFEAALPSPYAIDTVRFLRRRFPATRFVWIMGGDNLAQMHRWRNWTGLFRTLPILVLDRPGARLRALASPAARRFGAARLPDRAASSLPLMTAPAWIYMSLPLRDISSSALRQIGKNKLSLSR
jgi:nicotinate-nucleotide adenylyltransferase